jgi:hypothetical protein
MANTPQAQVLDSRRSQPRHFTTRRIPNHDARVIIQLK